MSGVGRTKMNNINSLRRSLRMSQAEFAEHCDMSVVSISRYESGAKISRNNAEKIAQMTGGELYEIVPEEAYGGENSNYYDESTRAYKEQYNTGGEQRPAIEETLENSSQYDVVFLGSPIWYGKSPRVILSFLDKYGFQGKTVIPFVTSMASGISRVNDELPATYPGIRWIEGRRLNGVSDASLQTWIDGILRTTAVSGIVADGSQHYNVYSLSGKRMLKNVSTLESLPASIYIVNGKKTIIK